VRLHTQHSVASFLVAVGHCAYTQQLLSGTRTEGDSIRARGSLQGVESVVGTYLGQVGHFLLFDEEPLAGEHLHYARDNPLAQVGRCLGHAPRPARGQTPRLLQENGTRLW